MSDPGFVLEVMSSIDHVEDDYHWCNMQSKEFLMLVFHSICYIVARTVKITRIIPCPGYMTPLGCTISLVYNSRIYLSKSVHICYDMDG